MKVARWKKSVFGEVPEGLIFKAPGVDCFRERCRRGREAQSGKPGTPLW